MNYLVANLQQSHAASRAEFDAVDARISQSLATHNRVQNSPQLVLVTLRYLTLSLAWLSLDRSKGR